MARHFCKFFFPVSIYVSIHTSIHSSIHTPIHASIHTAIHVNPARPLRREIPISVTFLPKQGRGCPREVMLKFTIL